MPDDNRYDRIPYKSHPFPQSHPDRLGTIATLAGMSPASLETCRVLELGCAAGGNLIPVAERFPGAALLGIDSSQRQIEEGQSTRTHSSDRRPPALTRSKRRPAVGRCGSVGRPATAEAAALLNSLSAIGSLMNADPADDA